MKNIYFCLLIGLFFSVSVYAGANVPIDKNTEVYKKLNISVDSRQSENDANKMVYTVKIKRAGIGEVYLVINGKMSALTPTLKDDLATITFEVNKKDIEEDLRLNFSYPDGSRCPDGYALMLKEKPLIKNDFFK